MTFSVPFSSLVLYQSQLSWVNVLHKIEYLFLLQKLQELEKKYDENTERIHYMEMRDKGEGMTIKSELNKLLEKE